MQKILIAQIIIANKMNESKRDICENKYHDETMQTSDILSEITLASLIATHSIVELGVSLNPKHCRI